MRFPKLLLAIDAVELVLASVIDLMRVDQNFIIDEVSVLIDKRTRKGLLDVIQRLEGAELAERRNIAEQESFSLVEIGRERKRL